MGPNRGAVHSAVHCHVSHVYTWTRERVMVWNPPPCLMTSRLFLTLVSNHLCSAPLTDAPSVCECVRGGANFHRDPQVCLYVNKICRLRRGVIAAIITFLIFVTDIISDVTRRVTAPAFGWRCRRHFQNNWHFLFPLLSGKYISIYVCVCVCLALIKETLTLITPAYPCVCVYRCLTSPWGQVVIQIRYATNTQRQYWQLSH